MRIADFCRQDTGGQSFKLARAINAYTEHECRSFRGSSDYLEFPVDVPKAKAREPWVREYIAKADVIHCHGTYRSADGWGQLNPRAKWLMHMHGRPGNQLAEFLKADKARGALRCVSTLNLLGYVDNDAERWIPAPFDLAEFDAIKARHYKSLRRRDRVIQVAHSPTRRDYKGTEDIKAAVDALVRDGLKVRLVLIEGQPHARALALKAACDITFDQMHLCYGNSGLEGFAFGQPTIVGMGKTTRKAIKRVVGYEPFAYADKDTLVDVLRELVTKTEKRREFGAMARRYMEEWHAHAKVAKRVVGLYGRIAR